MSLILSGTDGLSDIDGTAATPAIRGTDANTGIFFPAADTIAFSEGGVEAMRIDSSGNVGIGTSSPSSFGSPLSVYFATNPTLSIVSGNANAYLRLHSTSDNNMYLTNTGGAMTMNTVNTERMRIDSSGNLGIGTTSPSSRLHVKGTDVKLNFETDTGATAYIQQLSTAPYNVSFFNQNAGSLIFGTNNTESARIDSSGNLLVGTTSTQALSKFLVSITPGTTTGYATLPTTATGYTAATFLNSVAAGIGSITTTTVATLFNTTSDQRLKENIVDADDAAYLIDSLQVRKFDWKIDNTHQRYGFVAQELVAVAPEAVHQPTNEEEMMAVDYSKLVPMLVKEIQSLRKRLAAANL